MSSALQGFLESAQRLVRTSGKKWSHQDLLAAAQRAVLRNTGWPIGLVLTKRGLAPSANPEGIEARITSRDRIVGGGEDFWALNTDGSYYVARAFEEDFPREGARRPQDEERFIWFDVRIWRIAEVILHSAALYRELGVSPDEPYLLAISHHGLEGRGFKASGPRHVLYERYCRYPTVEWLQEVTQDYISANLQALVGEVANNVFVLFEFSTIDEGIIKEIVDEFLRRSV